MAPALVAGVLGALLLGALWRLVATAGVRTAALLPEAGGPAGSPVAALEGLRGEDQGLRALLLPMRADLAGRAFHARALGERLGLSRGAPWVLELSTPAVPDEEALASVVVRDERGVALAVPGPVSGPAHDPLARLFQEGRLPGPDGSLRLTLWGRAPLAPATLEVDGRALVLEACTLDPHRLVRGYAVLGGGAGADDGRADEAHAQGDVRALQRELEQLREELGREQARRIEREQAWLEYNRSLASLGPLGGAGPRPFAVDREALGLEEPEEDEPPPADDEGEASAGPAAPDPVAARLAELARSVRAFLVLADLKSYDLLELGSFQDEPPYRGVGPVVFRLFDDRGRLSGSLFAERLRMEGSRSGRTVSLVLEDGYESHGGERFPFADGVRRIPVPFLDPAPWVEACPELFPAEAFAALEDDGSWDREALRRELNRLLALDTQAGWYRFRGIGGVVRGQLTDVQLEVLDGGGRLLRRLFADRLTILSEPPGMALLLEDGVIVRGEEKEAFRDGELRVYLARARLAEWRAAGLPGLHEGPRAAPDAPVGEGSGG